MGWRRLLLGTGSLAVVVLGLSVSSNASAEELVSPSAAGAANVELPSCSNGLRLRVVQFDPNRAERSFVVFAGSSLRAPPLRSGARVGAYQIERIERGAAVLATAAQRCSVRLRNMPVERELRAISVEAVRSGLRARSTLAARASLTINARASAAPQPTAAQRAQLALLALRR